VLDFVMRMENVDTHEAAMRVNEWFNLGLEQEAKRPGEERRTVNAVPAEKPNGVVATTPPKEEASSEEPAESGSNKPLKFVLKNLKSDHAYMAERGLTPETVSAFGLGFCAKGTMSGRVVIPIHNVTGELVGYVGRWPGEPVEDRPKYKLPAGFKKSAEVFNLHRALQEQPEQPLIVVEGFFDVMKLWQLGYKRAVSIMGSSLSIAQEQLLLDAAQNGTRIVLMFDEDDSGRKGREHALLRLAKRAYVRVIEFLEPDMQPDHLKAEDLATLLAA
jgi:DNA primase